MSGKIKYIIEAGYKHRNFSGASLQDGLKYYWTMDMNSSDIRAVDSDLGPIEITSDSYCPNSITSDADLFAYNRVINVEGLIGGAIRTKWEEGYLVADNISLAPDAVTVSFWAKLDPKEEIIVPPTPEPRKLGEIEEEKDPGPAPIIAKYDELWAQITTNTIDSDTKLQCYFGSNNSFIEFPFGRGDWQHVMMWRYAGKGKLVYISLNDNTPYTLSNSTWTSNANKFLVAGTSEPYESIGGMIDDIGIWDRVLTSDERTLLHNNRRGVPFIDLHRINPVTGIVKAYINHGRWVADCPDCNGAELVSKEEKLFFCRSCGNIKNGGRCRNVLFPSDYKEIEKVVLARPMLIHRNWEFYETVTDLKKQNEDKGDPVEVSYGLQRS